MPKEENRRVHGCYLRDDGELMIEVQPGEFVSELAARRGLVHPNILVDIHRIKVGCGGRRRGNWPTRSRDSSSRLPIG